MLAVVSDETAEKTKNVWKPEASRHRLGSTLTPRLARIVLQRNAFDTALQQVDSRYMMIPRHKWNVWE